jgi:hypothetical protein
MTSGARHRTLSSRAIAVAHHCNSGSLTTVARPRSEISEEWSSRTIYEQICLRLMNQCDVHNAGMSFGITREGILNAGGALRDRWMKSSTRRDIRSG